LARCIGADRAYFILPGAPTRMLGWCREGAGFPAGWPARAPALAARFPATEEGIVQSPVSTACLPAPTNPRSPTPASGAGPACRAGGGAQRSWLRCAAFGHDHARRRAQPAAHGSGRARQCRAARDPGARPRPAGDQPAAGPAHGDDRRAGQRHRHNFNNIVGAILGYTEMAEAQVGPAAARPTISPKSAAPASRRAISWIRSSPSAGGATSGASR
jgi:hypothetical protein